MSVDPLRPRVRSEERRRKLLLALGASGAAVVGCFLLKLGQGEGQPAKYMTGAAWKSYLGGGADESGWFSRW